MAYHVGFYMDQIAGHVTNYRNLRGVAENYPSLKADWHEIFYLKPNGRIERWHKVVPFVPDYFTGILRASVEMRRGLHNYKQYDALFTNASVALFFSRVFRRVPTLLDFDSTPVQIDNMEAYTPGGPDPFPIANFKFWMFRRNLESATLLQAWSNWAKQSVITDYGIDAAKVVVNPPGIDLKLWKPNGSKPARSEDQPLKILFVGGDFRRKGGPLLLEWFKTLNHSRYELHLVTREPVESVPGVHVYHNMEPNSPELLRLYHTSDLFILPSLGECFGIATIEAMGAGLPVIATDVGGTADIIEPGRNGLIIPSKDVKAIGQAIETILGDDAGRVEMGRQSRILAEERFDLEKNARRTFSYLEQIAAKQVVKRPVAV